MADIVITIPDDQVARAVDALCIAGGYTGPPKATVARRDFARAQIAQYVRQTVLQVERDAAMSAAISSVAVDPLTVD